MKMQLNIHGGDDDGVMMMVMVVMTVVATRKEICKRSQNIKTYSVAFYLGFFN